LQFGLRLPKGMLSIGRNGDVDPIIGSSLQRATGPSPGLVLCAWRCPVLRQAAIGGKEGLLRACEAKELLSQPKTDQAKFRQP
jgi:hypothetical protein